jgi:predicted nucleic acid-binding protein
VILVDSSVWIDYLRGAATPQTDKLDTLLGSAPVLMGDLVLTEVLQGCGTDREFNDVRRALEAFELVTIGGADVAAEAARNYRRLRALGVTVRKTVDTLIATRCLVSGYELLHADRDFEPFAQHLGLRCVACEP